MIFWEFLFFLLFFVCGLFVQWNECSLLFSLKENTMEWMLFFSAQSCKWNFFYHCTSTDFFHILQISYEIKKQTYIPMRIWPYASSSLHVTDLETMYLSRLSEYGTEENVDWIYAIWFWPVLHLTLLVVFVFLFVFSVALPPPLPRHHGLCLLPFVLKLAVSLLDYFILFRLLNSLFYVTPGKTSDRCLFCFSG